MEPSRSAPTAPAANMKELQPELKRMIFSYLNVPSAAKCQLVAKEWHAIIQSDRQNEFTAYRNVYTLLDKGVHEWASGSAGFQYFTFTLANADGRLEGYNGLNAVKVSLTSKLPNEEITSYQVTCRFQDHWQKDMKSFCEDSGLTAHKQVSPGIMWFEEESVKRDELASTADAVAKQMDTIFSGLSEISWNTNAKELGVKKEYRVDGYWHHPISKELLAKQMNSTSEEISEMRKKRTLDDAYIIMLS